MPHNFGTNLNIILTMMKMVDMPGSHQENVAEGALVLFGVVVAFTICWAPPLIKNILKETFQTYQLEWIQVLNQVGWCTVAINSSINFFIYCLVGKQYREHFKAVFTCFSTPHPHHAGGKEDIKTVSYNKICFRFQKQLWHPWTITSDSTRR